ncbi:MAG TPA: valine--tRNA ligase [Candidatus Angelobacter sp.]|jgi:valyl-tRNA synthetase|nr:valine--tRNA ligase [Candidatus Angelobacter sp.]
MDKSFDPHAVEPRWLERWEELKLGVADVHSPKPSFVISLPPPNITGVLHMGHAVMGSVQDILCRHRRMNGYEVEWCPGTDHAAIATQNVIERQLAEEGTSKEALGRAGFELRVERWYAEYGGRILQQMRELGFSLDWSRTRFTLDPQYVRAIRTAFKSLYDQGLIYRGPRIVNWCPRCRSAISDEEIDWQEHTDAMVQLRYPVEEGGSIVIATVRPETMLADTGVAVHPDDPRYKDMIGKHVVLPLSGRRIPIVADEGVEREFGTGALKVTPGHDPLDFEIAQRHGLPIITAIGFDGRMTVPDLPQFDGLTVTQARHAVLQALRDAGVVVKEEEYVHDVGHCDRCGEVLEPLISEQWWVSMKPLAAPAIEANEQGRVRFHPRRFNDVYLSWMRNIRDWCISRQIWLGHSIPVSICANGHRFAWIEPPTQCEVCGNAQLTSDPDVLDTWFSSALWPFAIFGWPDDTDDLRRFYPTDVLGTAREIIFLWVARMVMTGLRFMDSEPFYDVIINSTILAVDGSRMSKSKGNAIDPVTMTERYGADAVRAWAGAVGTSGQDVRFDEDRIASYQRFANKLWNVTRFLVTRLGDGGDVIRAPREVPQEDLAAEDRWLLARLAETVDACNSGIEQYRFHDAMERLYDTTWHGFCDWYVEMSKTRLRDGADPRSRDAAAWTATTALDVLLRLLHPFMPFITEECAQRLPGAAPTLQRRDWPAVPEWWRDGATQKAREAVDVVLELVQSLRAARQEAGVPAASRERQPLVIDANGHLQRGEVARLVESLAPFSVVSEAPPDMTAVRVVAGTAHATLFLDTAARADDTARLRKQLGDVATRIEQLQQKLANPGFTERAPSHVVEGARNQLDEARAEQARLRGLLGEDAA